MKRAPFTYGVDLSGKKYWRSLGELAESKEFQEALAREFPEGASELSDGISRRSFLSLMGASVGLAGLAACRRPEEKILPFSRAPEHLVPGNPQYYATALPLMGTAIGLLVESHEGRPTKIEGNPRHPDSLGGVNAFGQATVLDLYDPDRSQSPREKGQERSWDDAEKWLRTRGAELKKNGGKGLVLLTEGHRSPTLAAALTALKREMPEAKVHRYEPFSRENAREGARIAFNRSLEAVLDVEKADVILALESDFLFSESSPIKNARGFGKRRRVAKPGDTMSRLYVAESAFTTTGSSADHRLRVPSRDVAVYALALARELSAAHGIELGELGQALAAYQPDRFDKPRRWVSAVAKDLAKNRGRGLIIAGQAMPPFVHAVVALLNEKLGNVGKTVSYVRPFDEGTEGPSSVTALAKSMQAGQVDTLIMLGGNPVFTAPADAKFAEAMAKVPNTVHLATHVDETGEAATWHLNAAHYLEAWSDVRAEDGTATIIQPLIAPLFGGRTDAEVVHLLLGTPQKAHDLVRATWQAERPADAELAWRRALVDGLWANSAWPAEQVSARPVAVADAVRDFKPVDSGIELTVRPDSHAFDGRFANNGWLNEMPDPMTKLTWDNAALIAPATAVKLGVGDGDVVEIAAGDRKARFPVVLAPGQAEDSVAITAGLGRRTVGRVGKGVGFDGYALRTSAGDAVQGVSVKRTGELHELARTQEHSVMEGRPIVREAELVRFQEQPDFAKKMVEHPPLKSPFKDYEYDGHRWGMVIDLNACVGCNACMVACQAENNIPLVGKSGVIKSREMHWIRVDRYFEGERIDDPKAVFQPMGCQQCENAPCEQVCPVGATTHSPEGLNDMAYNRCVGTRYCANNCPFKVRRFNFFNYTKDLPQLQRMQQNPDVTVRSRGVMEKCTYCVQRIQHAKINAKREGRERVRDGEVVAACQQTCPSSAIFFGDLNDKDSAVAQHAAMPRDYQLLSELNIRPRTSYLARVRNPNPELDRA